MFLLKVREEVFYIMTFYIYISSQPGNNASMCYGQALSESGLVSYMVSSWMETHFSKWYGPNSCIWPEESLEVVFLTSSLPLVTCLSGSWGVFVVAR